MDFGHFHTGQIQRHAARSLCCLTLFTVNLNTADPHNATRRMLLKQIARA
jgi:hypothetical protein